MALHARQLSALALTLACLPAAAAAQQAASITGRVTGPGGPPIPYATVAIEGTGLGTLTRDDGTYTLLVPGARATGQTATLTARVVGYKPSTAQVTLTPGAQIVRDFALEANPLRLGEVVITGAGTTSEVEKLGNVRNVVTSEQIVRSNEANVVQALAAKAPNVEVTQSSGEPGASSYIRMRGTRTISGSGQPLFVVDGVPIDNSSFSTSNFNPVDELGTGEISGTTQPNRAVDLNPDDIENVEILKGAAAGAIYGARAGQGVVLITTKAGRCGPTRYTLRSSTSFDDVNHTYPLQRTYAQGQHGVTAGPNACDDPNVNGALCTRSWGAPIVGPSYDHANEAYTTGVAADNTLTVSGGNDRTTFYLSGERLQQTGVFKGPNNDFRRTSVRLKATHKLADAFTLGGNIAYADTRGDFVQRGNNVNGLQLGLLRTPPNFNNLPYLDPVTGLHRSYRMQHPTPFDQATTRGFDNPFFAMNEQENLAQSGRVYGNVNALYLPTNWLRVNYTLGADYSNDERLEGAPQASSDVAVGGRVTEGKIVNYQLDHNLAATANYTINPNLAGTFTLGQNLNVREQRLLANVGRTLIAPQPYRLSNTVVRDPAIDNQTIIHGESYFGQATFDMYDQLYLTAGLRNDASSTFSESHRRSWFPKASVSWNFNQLMGDQPYITFGKLRAAYGETGQEPLPYLTSFTYSTTTLLGITQGTGLTPTQSGLGGLASSLVKGATDLRPERTKELETGFDVGLLRDKADLSFTFYNARTEDVILQVPLPPSSGYQSQAKNAGVFRNRGLELVLNVRPIQRADYGWDMGFQWATNKSKVLDLQGVDFVVLDNINTITPYQVARKGFPVGVFYDYGIVRCGISPNGMDAAVPGVDLATACAGAPLGAMYIDTTGFPVQDPNIRVIGDPNPKWTGSIRSSFRYKKAALSGLIDIRHGGVMYNGTKGALYSYGTHKDTEIRATYDPGTDTFSGNEHTFGTDILPGAVVGPGAGKAVPIGENWYRDGIAPCPFVSQSELCLEHSGFVKLRDISLDYTFDEPWVTRSLGLSSLNLRLSGRNLATWTRYTGYDPETNLGGAIQKTRGMDYFNMPQTRSFVVTVTLNR